MELLRTRIAECLSKQLDDKIKEGLRLKGFEFENKNGISKMV